MHICMHNSNIIIFRWLIKLISDFKHLEHPRESRGRWLCRRWGRYVRQPAPGGHCLDHQREGRHGDPAPGVAPRQAAEVALSPLPEWWCGENTESIIVILCSSQYNLAATSTDMNGSVCSALVQFGCYQHRHEWIWRPPFVCCIFCSQSQSKGQPFHLPA